MSFPITNPQHLFFPSPSPSAAGTQDTRSKSAVLLAEAMRFAIHIPGAGTRLTYQYSPRITQDLIGKQRPQSSVPSIWLATAACQVLTLSVSLSLIKVVSDGDPPAPKTG